MRQAGAEGDQPGELDEAVSWLTEALAGGAVGAKEIVKQALEVGFARSTIKKAKRELGVQSQKAALEGGKEAGWAWVLPGS